MAGKPLTDREQDIYNLRSEGYTVNDIVSIRGYSKGAVSYSIQCINAKLGVVKMKKIETNKDEDNTHGGKREGAGRKSTGRSKKMIYVTDSEYEKIKQYIEELRKE